MPDIKERLLQIVSHTEPMDAMDELLENLRCDRCKYWRELDDRSIRCVKLNLWTRPDFFCAIWAAKSA